MACTRQILGLLFLAAALLVPATARAGDDTWDAAVNGYFHDDTKWTDGLAPTAADTVEFGVNTTPYEVWWDATTGNRTTQSMSLTDGDVTFRIENGAGPYTWTITNGTSDADVTIMWGALTLGTAGDTGTLTLDIDHSLVVRYGGTLSVALGNEVQSRQTSVGDLGASLTIEDGGQVRNITGQVTSFSGSAGTVTVTGPGSTWTNSGTLYVGHWGAGTLNIEDEGLVESAEGFLGYGSGSSGTVTVTGGGSTWTNSGGLSVGDVGAGTLTIEAGGLVSNTFSDLGHLSGSSGEATVTGADSMWTNSAGLSIGTFGDGRLTIEAGGHVVNTDGYLGRWSSGTGFATVTGADSTWGNSGSLSVGYNGDGALTVEAGGQVSNTAAGYLGRIAGSTGTATVTGVGSTWGNSGSFYVGYNGDGTLTVEAGGYVSSVWGLLGNGSGSSGTVTVTGAGSTWNSSDFIVGLEGIGTLTVEAGGQVTSDYGYLGFYSGSTGTVSVTGEGSTWETTNSLYLGGTDTDDGGDASVTVSDGGRLYVGDEAANYTLSSSVSAVVVSDGDTTGGALWVRNGALLTNDGRAYLGYGSGETGAVTVTGGGSTWENSTGLCVGYYGTGTLTVTDGGLVTAGTLYASPGDLLGNGTIETHGAILDTDLVFDSTHGLVQALAFGTGGTLNLNVDGTGGLGAGHQGTGTLRIADGLTVTSPFGVLGYRSGSTGTATVTGGSTWTNSGELYVGFKGDGDLTVEAGGAVSNSFGYVALYSGRTGAVTVTGFTEDPDRNSTWQCTGNLYLGGTDTDDGGDADVALMNGGRFYVGDQAAAAAAAFEVSDTVLVVSDGDTVGGELWVRNGAVLTNDGGAYLGYGAGETGTTKVTGAGSTLANPVELFVGHEGTGTLTVEDGGQVSNDYGVLGVCSGSTGAATVTGTGSTWTNSVTLRVGLDGVGTLTVTDGGRVTAGTLYASPSDLFGNGTIETHGAILDTGLVFDSTHGLVQTLPFGTGGTLALDVDGTGGLGAGHQGTGTLTIDDGLTVMSTIGMLGHRAGSTGTATVTGGSTWINSGALYVGSGGNGELTVEAGGHVVNTDGYLGQWPAGSGTATVTGGSTWTSSGDLYVGCYGTGTLAVEAGGTVGSTDGYLGYEPGSSGTATVTGSTWTSSGDLYVGYEGGGTLNIAGNGHVSSAWSVLGDGSGSSGTVKVTGGVSTWNAGILYVGGYDTGTLTVEDGGTVSSGMGFLGRESGANGTATVTGAGSTWADLLELYVGDEGDGTLNIEDGGEVSSTYGYLGYESGSTGTATVTGAGSTWADLYDLYVGVEGAGTLNIEAGGEVTSDGGRLGFYSGSTGTAKVTGGGSTWSISGNLYVGRGGTGTLTIEAGGQVSSHRGYLGYEPGSTGTVSVTGEGSTWETTDSLYLGGTAPGDGGQAEVTLSGGGRLYVGDKAATNTLFFSSGVSAVVASDDDTTGGELWLRNGALLTNQGWAYLGYGSGETGTATVTGSGSTWTNGGSLHVGYAGTGRLEVTDGGRVTARTLYASPSNLCGDGTIEANGAVLDTDLVFDSTHGLVQTLALGTGGTLALDVDGTGGLGAGHQGTGTLRIADGLTVTSDFGVLGHRSGSTGTATVTGDSTWTISTSLQVGLIGTGELTVEAGGAVSNSFGYVARYGGSTGPVTVTGEESTWQCTENLYLGGTDTADGGDASVTVSDGGRLYVGDRDPASVTWPPSGSFVLVSDEAGDGGELVVRNGAVLDNDGLAMLGGEAGETGTATVRGAGSTWANQSMLFVGNLGTGTLGIRNGGSVSGGLGRVARYGGSTGTVTVEGEGSTWLSRLNLYLSGTESEDGGQAEVTLEAGGRLHVGDIEPLDVTVPSGVSAVVVSDGGATGSNLWLRHGAVLTNDGWAYLGYSSGETGTVTVIGGTWTNSSSLYVGRDGDGELTIAAGGLVSNTHGSLGGLPVVGSTSTGTATVTGSGSTWTNSCGLCVGVAGAGTLTIEAGGQVESDVGLLGATLDSRGMATVTGGGSTWTNSGGLCVGQEGAGTLTIEAGGAVSSADGQVAWFDTATGTVTLDGGAWTTTDYVSIGGSDYEAGGTGTVTVFPGGLLSVGTRLFLWPDGTLNLLGGTVRFHAADPVDDQGGTVDYVAGTVAFDCDVPIGAGMSQVTDFFGSPATIPAGKGLEVTGTATLWTPVTIDGGTLSVGSIVHGALLDFQSGTFNLTDDDLAIAPTGLFGDTVMLPTGKTINVTNTATVDSGAMLHLTGGHFSAGTLANDGLVRLDDPHSALGGGTLVNGGVLTGTGRVNARLDNQVAGEVRIGSGEEIVFTASGNTNAGEIKLLGGIAEFEGDLTNVSTGFISGRGVLDVAGGLTNLGVLAFSGGFTDLYGDVTNDAAAQIVISGGSVTTFYDDLASNGEIRVSAECSAVFFGAFTGTGGTTGSGTVYIEGDLRPGHSPAEVSFGGDMVFGPAAALEVELGGTAPAAYDAVHVAGTATLGGTLAVDLIDPYRPSHNDAFEVMTFASRGGTTFAAHEGLNLGDRLALVPTYGDTDLVLTAVQGGPGEWAVDGDGDASVPANWSAGLPNGVGDVATFGSVITAPREVTVDTPTTLGRLVFDSVEAYALAGPNPLTFETEAGAAAIDVADLAATHVIGADVVLADALEVDVAALGTLVFDGTLDNGSGLTLTKTGTGLLVIDGPQDHAPGADFEVLGGTVEMKSDASGTGFMDDADLSIFVADATLDFGCDQHLDTLEIGDDGLVRFTGANVVVVKNLVMNGIPLGPTTLTPEPATLGLLGAGLLGIAASRRRRTHA